MAFRLRPIVMGKGHETASCLGWEIGDRTYTHTYPAKGDKTSLSCRAEKAMRSQPRKKKEGKEEGGGRCFDLGGCFPCLSLTVHKDVL